MQEDVILSIQSQTSTTKNLCPVYYTKERSLEDGASALMTTVTISSTIEEASLLKMGAALVIDIA